MSFGGGPKGVTWFHFIILLWGFISSQPNQSSHTKTRQQIISFLAQPHSLTQVKQAKREDAIWWSINHFTLPRSDVWVWLRIGMMRVWISLLKKLGKNEGNSLESKRRRLANFNSIFKVQPDDYRIFFLHMVTKWVSILEFVVCIWILIMYSSEEWVLLVRVSWSVTIPWDLNCGMFLIEHQKWWNIR